MPTLRMCVHLSNVVTVWVALVTALGVWCAQAATITLDPATALSNAVSLAEWETGGDFEGWTLNNTSGAVVNGGALTWSTTGASGDPQVILSLSNADPGFGVPSSIVVGTGTGQVDRVEIRMRLDSSTATSGFQPWADWFFSPNPVAYRTQFGTANGSVGVALPFDDTYHTYRIQFDAGDGAWGQTLTGVRLDPIGSATLIGQTVDVDVDYVRYGLAASGPPPTVHTGGPNFVVVLVDDMGYSDFGCYGGEIETPNIDTLASNGVRFAQYYTSPQCVVTRIGLLSGLQFQQAGSQAMTNAVTFPQLLKDEGYATSASGKWHIGNGGPAAAGFDRFFGFLGGATDNFNGGGDWQLNGAPFSSFPPGFYATDAITDYALNFIGEAATNEQSFCLYLSYNAPHVPIQAPQADVEKYLGVYSNGFESLREARLARQVQMGLVDAGTTLRPAEAEVRPWELLTDQQRADETRYQAGYAAMVDIIDQNVGRVMDFLEQEGLLSNTVVFVASDNGADYVNQYRAPGSLPWNTATSTDNAAARLRNTPWHYYKHTCHEGGQSSPLIVHWPEGISVPDGTILPQMARVYDIGQTILDVAGIPYPSSYAGRTLKPSLGESLQPLFSDANAAGPPQVFYNWYFNSRSYVSNQWKVVSYEFGPWELYDLSVDRTETRNRAAARPDIVQDLAQAWFEFAANEAGIFDRTTAPAGDEHLFFMHHRVLGDGKITNTYPKVSASGVPLDAKLKLQFSGVLDFNGTAGKEIRLQRYGDPAVLWSADPDPAHPAQGATEIEFTDFPELAADTHYFITWDAGWAKVNGSNLPVFRDVTRAYRFRTAASYAAVVDEQPPQVDISVLRPELDASGNGFANFQQYVFGGTPIQSNPNASLHFLVPPAPGVYVPPLWFRARNDPADVDYRIQYAYDLLGDYEPLAILSGGTVQVMTNLVQTIRSYPYGDLRDYTLLLDPAAAASNAVFVRVEAINTGPEILAEWNFSDGTLNGLALHPAATPSPATFMGPNQGVLSGAGPFTFPDPVAAWSATDLPQIGGAIDRHLQTLITVNQPLVVEQVRISGSAWFDRTDAVTNIYSADIVTFTNGVLRGITHSRVTLAETPGPGTGDTRFSIRFDIEDEPAAIGDTVQIRFRLQDSATQAWTVSEDGLGIDTVQLIGRPN